MQHGQPAHPASAHRVALADGRTPLSSPARGPRVPHDSILERWAKSPLNSTQPTEAALGRTSHAPAPRDVGMPAHALAANPLCCWLNACAQRRWPSERRASPRWQTQLAARPPQLHAARTSAPLKARYHRLNDARFNARPTNTKPCSRIAILLLLKYVSSFTIRNEA